MIRTILLAGAALAIASAPAVAATAAPTHTAPAPHAATRAVPAKPAVPARKLAVAKPRGKSGLVTTRLANGKTVTYDCHLAGNKAKTVCKGKG